MTKKLTATFIFFYSILFFLDGLISVPGEIITYYSDTHVLDTWRATVAYLAMFLCIPYVFIYFFIKNKKAAYYWLMPFFMVIIHVVQTININDLISSTSLFNFMAMAVSPHWIYKSHPNFFLCQLFLSVGQLIIGTYCAKKIWSQFKTMEFYSFKKAHWFLGGFTSSSFVGGYLALNIFMIASMLISDTKGFLAFDGTNVQSIEKIYQKNGKIVHLIPMIHIGDESFYKEIKNISSDKKALFLLEGVSDAKNLMEPMNHRNIASQIGLETQGDHFNPPEGKHVEKNIYYQTADIDSAEMSKETRDFLNKLMKIMNEKSFFELIGNGQELLPSKDGIASMTLDIVTKRNAKVFEQLKKQEKIFDEFYIPWGAAHMPEMEEELLKLGYVQIKTKERNIISIMDLANKFAAK